MLNTLYTNFSKKSTKNEKFSEKNKLNKKEKIKLRN